MGDGVFFFIVKHSTERQTWLQSSQVEARKIYCIASIVVWDSRGKYLG